MDNERDERSEEKVTDDINLDGRFEAINNDQGVYLAVYPPKGTGAPVRLNDISSYLFELSGIRQFDNERIMTIVRSATGEFTEIFRKTKATIEITLLKDNMEAFVQIVMAEGQLPVSQDELTQKVNQMGIVYGVSNEALEQALLYPNTKISFAKGLSPVNGIDAYIKYHISFENTGKPAELDGGRVDYKNLNKFVIVQKDTLLARKIQAVPGENGVNVLGKKLAPKPGKDVLLPAGKNIRIVDDLRLLAEKAGHVYREGGKIHVSDVIEIKEDVDLATGNIDFLGSVVIRGNIQAGFSVKAGADVEIFGNITGGIVEGRNILARMGIQGMNRGYVIATENITTKFIENAQVYANQDIRVERVILNSKINAGRRLITPGRIIGGNVSAGEEIRAAVAGTENHVNTVLQVGVNPRLREEYQKLKKDIKNVDSNLDQLKKSLDVLRAMDKSTLSPQKQELFLKMTKAQFQLVGQQQTMNKRIAEIEQILEDMKNGRVEISDSVYPGVKIVIGTVSKAMQEVARYSSFYSDGGEVRIGPYTKK